MSAEFPKHEQSSSPEAETTTESAEMQPQQVVEASTVETHDDATVEELDSVRERLGLGKNEASTVVPAQMQEELMQLFESVNDHGQAPYNQSDRVMDSISSAAPETQEALARKFHTAALSNFNTRSMTKLLGVYQAAPAGPFREELKKLENTRLEAAGFTPLP